MPDAPEAPTTTPPAGQVPNVIPSTPAGQGDPDQLGDAGKRALAAERKRADDAEKARKALQEQIDQIEAAKLSDLEKAQKAATDAATTAAQAQQEALRLRVAMSKGVPANLVDRLRGSTEEEIAADADELLKFVTPPTGAGQQPAPRPDLSQGVGSTGSSNDPAAQFAAFLGKQLTH